MTNKDIKEKISKYYQNPTAAATNDLININTPMVMNIINSKFNYPHHHDDLKQEGLIALWDCIQKYQPSQGEFSTYAYTAIKNRMVNWISRYQHVIRVPKLQPVEIHNDDKLYNYSSSEIEMGPLTDIVNNLSQGDQKIFMNFLAKKDNISKNEYKVAAKVKKILKEKIK